MLYSGWVYVLKKGGVKPLCPLEIPLQAGHSAIDCTVNNVDIAFFDGSRVLQCRPAHYFIPRSYEVSYVVVWAAYHINDYIGIRLCHILGA